MSGSPVAAPKVGPSGQEREERDDPRMRWRASDLDRQALADRLHRALNEGRLEENEFQTRLRMAYGARTYGEMEPLVADLPPAGYTSPYSPPAGSGMPVPPLIDLSKGIARKSGSQESPPRSAWRDAYGSPAFRSPAFLIVVGFSAMMILFFLMLFVVAVLG